MTATSLLLGLLLFLWVPMMAQTTSPDLSVRAGSEKKQNAPGYVERKDSALLSRLKDTRIIFKDGSIRKHCTVKQINAYWIVYEKDGSLHDLEIEKIKRIEICDGTTQAVFFDEKNKPDIGAYVY